MLYIPSKEQAYRQAQPNGMLPRLKLSDNPESLTTSQEINHYVEQLLTASEQECCDMATD